MRPGSEAQGGWRGGPWARSWARQSQEQAGERGAGFPQRGAPGGRRRGRLIQEFLLFRSRHITLVLSTGGSHHAGRGFPSSAPRMGLGRVALSLRLLIGGVGTGLAMSPGSHS